MTDQIEDERPVTTGAVMKWGGVFAAIGTVMIAAVTWINTQTSEITALRVQVETAHRHINKLEVRADVSDRSVADIQRKLDVVVTIVERIEKKIDRP
jgi:hypothetical protein